MSDRPVRRSLLFTGFLLLAVCQAAAQKPGSEEPGSIEDDLLFGEIGSVYAASKYEQPLSEAPSMVTIVTAAEIRAYDYRTISDVFDSVAGFYTTYDRAYSYTGVRGFGQPGDYDTRILMLLDGQRLNDNIFDSVGSGNDFVIDLDVIEQVEIIRGPGSSLYGANAFFAVVNIVTKDGRDMRGAAIEFQAGGQETYAPTLTYGNKFDNGVELLASASFFDTEGETSLYFPELDDPTTNNGMAESVDDDRNKRVFASLSYRAITFQGTYSTRNKTIPTGSYDSVFNDPRTSTNDKIFHVSLSSEHTFSNLFTLATRVEYNGYEWEGLYAYDWADPGDPPDVVVNHDVSDGKWWGGEVQGSGKIGDKHHLVGGLEFRDSLKQFQQNYDIDVYFEDSRNSSNWGLFLQDEFQIAKQVKLNTGVRYDHYDTFGGTTNPRVALIYSPVPRSSIKLMYGTAFRPPNAYELYYHDNFVVQKPGLDLEPETIKTYEVGFEQQLRPGLRGVISAYEYRIDDLLQLVLDPADDLLVFRNVDAARAEGVELTLEGKVGGQVTGALSFARQHSEDRATGLRLTNSPKQLAKLNLMIPILRGRTTVALRTQYTSDRLTVQGSRADSTFVSHLTLGVPDLLDGLSMSATVYNVFDEEYDHPASAEHSQNVIVQDGRSYRFTIRYDF